MTQTHRQNPLTFTRYDDQSDAFVRFCALQLQSQDVDPVYPMLRYLYADMDTDEALWRTFVYVAYYNIVSAAQVWATTPAPGRIPGQLTYLSTGIERRGLRGGKVKDHLASIVALHTHYKTFHNWLTQGFTDDPAQNWQTVDTTLQVAWGNGRWASYKTREILYTVHGFPIVPTDMGNENSSGPRQGLELFYPAPQGNSSMAIAILDQQGDLLLRYLASRGVQMDIAQLETMLCDFHSLYRGNYYVGHDIDLIQSQLRASDASHSVLQPLWEARHMAFDQKYLGEYHDWQGVDVLRKKAYMKWGKVLDRDE